MKHLLQWINDDMLNLEFCLALDKPWIRRIVATRSEIEPKILAWMHNNPKISVFFLDGSQMQSLNDFFNELIRGYSLPDYFGRNFNALDECLNDESVLDGTAFLTVIFNADKILTKDCHDRFELFLDVLTRAGDDWAVPINVGEAWDRPAKPFHVIMQYEPTTFEAFRILK